MSETVYYLPPVHFTKTFDQPQESAPLIMQEDELVTRISRLSLLNNAVPAQVTMKPFNLLIYHPNISIGGDGVGNQGIWYTQMDKNHLVKALGIPEGVLETNLKRYLDTYRQLVKTTPLEGCFAKAKTYWFTNPNGAAFFPVSPLCILFEGNERVLSPLMTGQDILRTLTQILMILESMTTQDMIIKTSDPRDNTVQGFFDKLNRIHQSKTQDLNAWFNQEVKQLQKKYPQLEAGLWETDDSSDSAMDDDSAMDIDENKTKENNNAKDKAKKLLESWKHKKPSIQLSKFYNDDAIHIICQRFEDILTSFTLRSIHILEARIWNLIGWPQQWPSDLANARGHDLIWTDVGLPYFNDKEDKDYWATIPLAWKYMFTQRLSHVPVPVWDSYVQQIFEKYPDVQKLAVGNRVLGNQIYHLDDRLELLNYQVLIFEQCVGHPEPNLGAKEILKMLKQQISVGSDISPIDLTRRFSMILLVTLQLFLHPVMF